MIKDPLALSRGPFWSGADASSGRRRSAVAVVGGGGRWIDVVLVLVEILREFGATWSTWGSRIVVLRSRIEGSILRKARTCRKMKRKNLFVVVSSQTPATIGRPGTRQRGGAEVGGVGPGRSLAGVLELVGVRRRLGLGEYVAMGCENVHIFFPARRCRREGTLTG